MSAIVIAETVRIPASVVDRESFRRWARSDEYPKRGWFSYLHGELWVDLSMEQLFTHNQVKAAFTLTILGLLQVLSLGRFFMDRVLLSHPDTDLSTEPDGLFASWEAFRSGRIHPVEGAAEGFVELEGTPDMVLEVVSPSSIQKDTVRLRDLYWQAGISEYWLVDARGLQPRFDILQRSEEGYTPVAAQDGWLPSAAFSRAFQLTQQTDPLGYPQYTLAIRS